MFVGDKLESTVDNPRDGFSMPVVSLFLVVSLCLFLLGKEYLFISSAFN